MTSIIIPYRDRVGHLNQLIPRLHERADEILVIEQGDDRAFNRAKLLNIGALLTEATHLIFHDVDMVPISVDYSPAPGVTQLASSTIQRVDYLGGVTMFHRNAFNTVGGYHNEYAHRAEDNEIRFNLHRLHIPVVNRFGKFDILPHPRSGMEFNPLLWERAQEVRERQDQLAQCYFKVVAREKNDFYTKITVNL